MIALRFVMLAAAVAAAPAAALTYTATPVYTAGGEAIVSGGLGADGTVVGQTVDTLMPALRRPDGTTEILPTLGGSRGAARGINASGTVVGGARTGANAASNRPFVRSGGVSTALPIPAGGTLGFGTAINDAGTVVGTYQDGGGVGQSFRWSAGIGTTMLAAPAGYDGSTVFAINASGMSAGSAESGPGSSFAAVRWAADGAPTLLLGTRDDALASGINDAGTVVGFSSFRPAGPSFVTAAIGTVWLLDGTVIEVGPLAGDTNSFLSDINNLGVAVGTSSSLDFLGQEVGTSLVTWTLAGGLVRQDIDLSGFGLTSFGVSGINDAGQILVEGFGNDGPIAILLTPEIAAVPEPASWALMIAGFGLAGSALRRRRALAA